MPKPKLEGPEHAIVRVTMTSICGSDLHILHGRTDTAPGTIIGHEFVGIVEEVGAGVTTVKPGDRVVCMGLVNCGKCRACKTNRKYACEHYGVYGSGPIAGNLPGAMGCRQSI